MQCKLLRLDAESTGNLGSKKQGEKETAKFSPNIGSKIRLSTDRRSGHRRIENPATDGSNIRLSTD